MAIDRKKKILVLSSRVPFPLIGGDRIRIFNFGKHLSEKYDMDLLALHEGTIVENFNEELQNAYKRVVIFCYPRWRFILHALLGVFTNKAFQMAYYDFADAQRWFDAHIHEYDGVFVNHIRMMSYAQRAVLPKWIDLHDAISLNYSNGMKNANFLWRTVYRYEQKRVIECENAAVQEFQRTFIVSERDKRYLTERGCLSDQIVVVPVAVSDELLDERFETKEDEQICFIGKMDTVANIDAACYFAKEIFPELRKHKMNLRFVIVGAKPVRAVCDLEQIDGVKVTGWVRDPYKIVLKSKVVVAPMRIGAGMQNKVLEAMALQKAVVLSSLASDGIQAVPDRHYFVADDIDQYVHSILKLMEDGVLRKDIGVQARKWIETNHTWKIISRIFTDEFEQSFLGSTQKEEK